MRQHIIAAVTACLIALPTGALADSALLGKIGTLGVGVEFVQTLSRFTTVRAVANGGSLDEKGSESGIDYNFDLELRNAGVLIDWHPFAGVFFTSLGLFYNKNKLDARGTDTGTVTVGDNTYTNPDLNAEITFQTSAPYLGLGWGHAPQGRGLSMSLEIGVLYQGAPEVAFRSNSVSQADLDREAAELERELDSYKYYPQFAFGIGYRF
jgi:hypothetical protein